MSGLSFDPGLSKDELDRVFMNRCIELAKRGGKSVRPNPLVGSVLVHEGKVIGEGYHAQFGKAHAEVNCVRSVPVQNRKFIHHSTLYVTLEPCNMVGKTPACSELILNEHIPRVVVGALDPNPQVNGSSLDYLHSKGVAVKPGVCLTEAENLIRPFSVNMNQKRPYVILKVVKSRDNFTGRLGEKIWLSNPYSTTLSHKWRSETDGIMTGTTTVINDDPSLTTRLYPGENPVRIVLDDTGKIPASHQVFSNEAKTWVITSQRMHGHGTVSYIQQDFAKEYFITSILKKLFSLGIFVLLVEGGAKTIRSFILSGMWDEARIITCPMEIHQGVPAPNIKGKLIQKQMLLRDELQIIYNEVI